MGRSLYASDSYPQCKDRRLRRIRRRATPLLWQAFESGQLSLHALDSLSAKLQPRRQNQWLKKELQRRHEKSEGHAIAATVIREELTRSKVDLGRIASAIRDAIRVRSG